MTTDRVKTIIAEQLGITESEITNGSTLEEMGGDSLDGLELVMALEEEFDCEISDEIAETFTTVGDIIACTNTL